MISRLHADLESLADGDTKTKLRSHIQRHKETAFGRIFAATALDKVERGAIAEAVARWCDEVARWHADSPEFLVSKDEPDEKQLHQFARKAAKAGRQLEAAVTQLEQTRPQTRSAALIEYYGHDPRWPKPISDGEVEVAKDLLRRANTWNNLWERRFAGHPSLPAPEKRNPGRPTDKLLRDCESMLTDLLSSVGLKQRQVARYAFEFMCTAGLRPTSWQSIEQRLLKGRANRN